MRAIRTVALLIAATLMSTSAAYAWPEAEAKMGAQNHPRFLAQQGGLIDNRALSDYVTRIGQKIVANTPLAHEPWVFSVTDTPIVNAFAAPGGYVYITRGLLALANSEAELAAVLGHEVAHLTARHHAKRQKSSKDANIGVLVGTALGGLLGGKEGLKKGIELSTKVAAGYVGQFSQSQEFEADKLGTEYLAAANYDPYAQSRILGALGTKRAFEAKKSGKDYNPNRVDFFATHPATADRVRRAREFAAQFARPGERYDGEAPYMAAIDGLIYGDTAEQGFVRGRSFIHPVIKFKYTVPPNFSITNSARKVVAQGPNGAQFNLDGGGPANGRRIEEYLRNLWVPQIAKEVPTGRLSKLFRFSENGVNTVTATLPYKRRGEDWIAHLTVVLHNDRFIRLTGLTRASDKGLVRDFGRAARSFTRLSDREAANFRPSRLRSYEVQPGDTVGWLAMASPSQELRNQLFRAINAIPAEAAPTPGDLVKVITE